MAARLCHHAPARPLPHAQHTLPRIRLVEHLGLHMEQEEPGDETEFPRAAGVYGAVSALGVDGVQLGVAWDGAEG